MPNGRAISVRLDEEAVSALRVLENAGMTRSDAIRHAIVSTAQRAQEDDALRREVEALAANEEDRREMAMILEHMEELSEPW